MDNFISLANGYDYRDVSALQIPTTPFSYLLY